MSYVVIDLDRNLGAFDDSFVTTGRGQWEHIIGPNGLELANPGWETGFTVWEDREAAVKWAITNIRFLINPITGRRYRYQILSWDDWGHQLELLCRKVNHQSKAHRDQVVL